MTECVLVMSMLSVAEDEQFCDLANWMVECVLVMIECCLWLRLRMNSFVILQTGLVNAS